jgi:hypothetical protein
MQLEDILNKEEIAKLKNKIGVNKYIKLNNKVKNNDVKQILWQYMVHDDILTFAEFVIACKIVSKCEENPPEVYHSDLDWEDGGMRVGM